MLAGAALVRIDAFTRRAAGLTGVAARSAVVATIGGAAAALAFLTGIAVALALAARARAARPAGLAVEPRGHLAGHGAGFAEPTWTAGIEIRDAMTVGTDPALPASGAVLDRLGHTVPSLDARMHRRLGAVGHERPEYGGDRAGK
jgi:hypothetical protein